MADRSVWVATLALFSMPMGMASAGKAQRLEPCYCAVGTNGLENLQEHIGEVVCSQQQADAQLVRAPPPLRTPPHTQSHPPRGYSLIPPAPPPRALLAGHQDGVHPRAERRPRRLSGRLEEV